MTSMLSLVTTMTLYGWRLRSCMIKVTVIFSGTPISHAFWCLSNIRLKTVLSSAAKESSVLSILSFLQIQKERRAHEQTSSLEKKQFRIGQLKRSEYRRFPPSCHIAPKLIMLRGEWIVCGPGENFSLGSHNLSHLVAICIVSSMAVLV